VKVNQFMKWWVGAGLREKEMWDEYTELHGTDLPEKEGVFLDT
jgi:hypothetical protein